MLWAAAVLAGTGALVLTATSLAGNLLPARVEISSAWAGVGMFTAGCWIALIYLAA